MTDTYSRNIVRRRALAQSSTNSDARNPEYTASQLSI